MIARREAQRLAPRKAAPDAVLSQQEYATIQSLRSQAASRVAALRQDLESLESALSGRVAGAGPAGARGVAALKPRVSLYRSLLSQATQVPAVSQDQSPSALLATFGNFGLRDRSFDTVVPVTAPNPINDTGNFYDAGAVYDAWILNPSVDTKFDFQKPPSQNTPFISANSKMQFQLRAQKVYYLGQNAGVVGTLQIWLLKFAST